MNEHPAITASELSVERSGFAMVDHAVRGRITADAATDSPPERVAAEAIRAAREAAGCTADDGALTFLSLTIERTDGHCAADFRAVIRKPERLAKAAG